MTTILVSIASCMVTALIGGVVAFLFWKIEHKIDHMEAKTDQHNKEQIEMRKRERELLLANADLTLVIAKKEQGYDVNGDLKTASDYLQDKKHDVQDYTRILAIERMEGEA